jgi:hypothetical protein
MEVDKLANLFREATLNYTLTFSNNEVADFLEPIYELFRNEFQIARVAGEMFWPVVGEALPDTCNVQEIKRIMTTRRYVRARRARREMARLGDANKANGDDGHGAVAVDFAVNANDTANDIAEEFNNDVLADENADNAGANASHASNASFTNPGVGMEDSVPLASTVAGAPLMSLGVGMELAGSSTAAGAPLTNPGVGLEVSGQSTVAGTDTSHSFNALFTNPSFGLSAPASAMDILLANDLLVVDEMIDELASFEQKCEELKALLQQRPKRYGP